MCTSVVINKNKTLIGFNLDILDMEYRVSKDSKGVYIEINDAVEGWMPLFGGNSRGEFVGMPTCWPFDSRSNPIDGSINVINLDIDLLLQNKTFEETKYLVENNHICSVSGTTFMSSISDKNGNVLYIIPGQGQLYFEKPEYKVMTNFSPFKMNSEEHPWMGWDRYKKATEAIESRLNDDFDVNDLFEVLKKASQEVCPTVVSMVYDVTDKSIYWCENRKWDKVFKHSFN
ncbi:MAG: hypothetical protein MJ172_04160 [Clostridia bacterium]|nr:hypothetical protein [Clostridia bacterium]